MLALFLLSCARNVETMDSEYSALDSGSCLPNVFVSPTEFHFGVEAGTSETGSVTVTNLGCSTLRLDGLTLADPDQPWALIAVGSILVPSEMSTSFDVVFSPVEVGEFNTTARMETNDPDAPTTSVLLFGVAIGG